MISLIKGQTIKLYTKQQVGVDDFGIPIFEDDVVEVDNVLIEPASNEAVISEIELSGKHISYTLHIPKSDKHNWEDTTVEFYDKKWRTFGDCLIYDEGLTPMKWNKKVKVEVYE